MEIRRKRNIKVREKKAIFPFKKGKADISVLEIDQKGGERSTTLTVYDVTMLGDFGYHNHYKDRFTLFHLGNGLFLRQYIQEKHAKGALKKLYRAIPVGADPKNYLKEMKKLTVVGAVKPKMMVEHREDDIPF